MKSSFPSRRDFIGQATAAAALLPLLTRTARAAEGAPLPAWNLGCHGRAFRKWKLSLAGLLDAIRTAGYSSAEIIRFESESAGRPSNPEYVATMVQELKSRGLRTAIDYLALPKEGSMAERKAAARHNVEVAHALGQKYLICLGAEKESEWVDFCRVLADAAAFGEERGVQIVIKQHHGLNNTPVELLGWVQQVGHRNFGIFFDPGNLVYYTGRDPVAQLDLIAAHVRGVVAKDCTGPQYREGRSGDPGFGTQAPNAHGDEVMIQFGTGVVNQAAIFAKLKAVGFKGPVMVEGVTIGSSAQDTIANARANREYVERLLRA